MTRTGPLRPHLWQLEADRIAGPGGIRELGLDYPTVRALRGGRLLLVDDVARRVEDGTLGDVAGLGAVRTARIVAAVERHREPRPAQAGRGARPAHVTDEGRREQMLRRPRVVGKAHWYLL